MQVQPADRHRAERTGGKAWRRFLTFRRVWPTRAGAPPVSAPFGLFKDLEPPGGVVRDLGPSWFAAVMGTGIVANAGAILPLRMPGLWGFATVVWGLAAVVLIGLTAAWTVHWIRYPERARGHARHPVMAHFWGAPAMALMTVGTGTLVLGRSLLGTATVVDADWVLWGAEPRSAW